MNGLRLWIGLLTVVVFLSGLAAGLLWGRLEARDARTLGPFAAYRDALASEFDLSAERERALVSILDSYQQSLEELQARGLAQLEDELAERGVRFRELIRDYVLPESEHARFDQMMSAATEGSSASTLTPRANS